MALARRIFFRASGVYASCQCLSAGTTGLAEGLFFLPQSREEGHCRKGTQPVDAAAQIQQAALPEVSAAIDEMLVLHRHIFRCSTSERIMGYEGAIAKIYFRALGMLVPEEFAFERRSRRPPLDAFNAMLSFGYTLLMYDIYTVLHNEGLHPYFGFLHALKKGHPALASDLMEEWRAVLVDSMVLSLVHHHEIKPEHFKRSMDDAAGGIFLTREGRAIFLRAYEKKMKTVNKYVEGKHSYRRTLSYQARQYAQALMAQNEEMYDPIALR